MRTLIWIWVTTKGALIDITQKYVELWFEMPPVLDIIYPIAMILFFAMIIKKIPKIIFVLIYEIMYIGTKAYLSWSISKAKTERRLYQLGEVVDRFNKIKR